MGYRILDHTADIGVEVWGETLGDLFAQGALALFDLLTDRTVLTGEGERTVRVAGTDTTDVWINYLREVLYLFNGGNFLVKDVPTGFIEISKKDPTGASKEVSLVARCRGEIYDPRRHPLKTEIKAVTYHCAAVQRIPAGWQGVFIVDV